MDGGNIYSHALRNNLIGKKLQDGDHNVLSIYKNNKRGDGQKEGQNPKDVSN